MIEGLVEPGGTAVDTTATSRDRIGDAEVFCGLLAGRLHVFFDAGGKDDHRSVGLSWSGQREVLTGTSHPLGLNLIVNGDFSDGLRGWALQRASRAVGAGVDLTREWTVAGGHTAFVRSDRPMSGPSILAYSGGPGRGSIPVVGGHDYHVDALLGTHRCAAMVTVRFLGADGRIVSTFAEDIPPGRRGGIDRADYHLTSQTIRAPGDAVRAELVFQKGQTEANERDSFLFITDVHFGRDGKRFASLAGERARIEAVALWEIPTYASVPLPEALLDGGAHVVSVHAWPGGPEIAGSPVRVHVRDAYDGEIEQVDGGIVSGWVRHRTRPSRMISVSLEVDGEDIAIGPADLRRPSPGQEHGFSLLVPGHLLDDQAHQLLLRSVPDGAVVVEASHILSRQPAARTTGFQGGRSDESVASIARALGRSEAARRDLETRLQSLEAAARPLDLPTIGRDAHTRAVTARPRAAVVAWDVGHNPMGRAQVLHDLLRDRWDVDVIGPSWDRYGDGLWEPLREAEIALSWWRCRDIGDFMPMALLESSLGRYDLVVVSKPRLPSLLLGFLIKRHSECPLVLDIDDDELAFVGGGDALDLASLEAAGADALTEPYGPVGTRYGASLIPFADAITVSNVAIRERYGGHIVRHARDERRFVFSQDQRDAMRAELGIGDDDFALIFLGTARGHKGIDAVIAALHEMDDHGFALHVVGTDPDASLRETLARFPGANVRFHGPRPFSEIPAILSAADAVPLMQDPGHPIAASQIPAKLSDATALGRPVLVTRVPPMEDLLIHDGIIPVDEGSFASTLRWLRDTATPERAARIRQFFLGELSLSVNRARLDFAIEAAFAQRQPLPPDLPRLTEVATAAGAALVRRRLATAEDRPRAAKRRSVRSGTRAPDVVMFWKQNDTGLYGRRPEMLVKYLLRSGRIGRVMYYDAPMSMEQLRQHRNNAVRAAKDADGPLIRNTIDRWLGGLDDGPLMQRVHLHGGQSDATFMGRHVPPLRDIPDLVRRELEEHRFDPDHTVALVCPVVWQFPDVHALFPFSKVVVDLIDDQRAWPSNPDYRERLAASYLATIGLADVLVSNCQPNADAFATPSTRVHVIANGAEPIVATDLPRPRALARLSRPLIGYVGNMRDRINWSMLAELATRHPDWTFVMVGPTTEAVEARDLAEYPNVVMPGVVEYRELPAWLLSFDVAIVPHTRSQLTDRMNPLKVYNYLSAGLPVVATGVANLDDVRDLIDVADTTEAFEAALERILSEPRSRRTRARLGGLRPELGWEARTQELLALIDA